MVRWGWIGLLAASLTVTTCGGATVLGSAAQIVTADAVPACSGSTSTDPPPVLRVMQPPDGLEPQGPDGFHNIFDASHSTMWVADHWSVVLAVGATWFGNANEMPPSAVDEYFENLGSNVAGGTPTQICGRPGRVRDTGLGDIVVAEMRADGWVVTGFGHGLSAEQITAVVASVVPTAAVVWPIGGGEDD